MEWNREQGVATPCFEKRGKLCLDSSVSSINNQPVEMVIVFAMTKDHCDTVSYAGILFCLLSRYPVRGDIQGINQVNILMSSMIW